MAAWLSTLASAVWLPARPPKGPPICAHGKSGAQRPPSSQIPSSAVVLLDQATTAELVESPALPGGQPTAARRPAPAHPWRKPILTAKRTKSLDINTIHNPIRKEYNTSCNKDRNLVVRKNGRCHGKEKNQTHIYCAGR